MRRHDWYHRLWETMGAGERKPFDYDGNTCAHLTARLVDAMTGSGWAEKVPKFRSHFGMWCVLALEGGLARAITRRLGPSVDPVQALTGYVVIVRFVTRRICGVLLNDVVIVQGMHGIEYWPRKRAVAAWPI